VAVCPSLPGCITRARTHREVLRRHQVAVEGYIASVGNAAPGRIDFDVVNGRRNAALKRMYPVDEILQRPGLAKKASTSSAASSDNY